MPDKRRKIEIFSAGCSACEDAIREVKNAACPSCDIRVLDMKTPEVRRRAAELGIKSVPAVVIDGVLAGCCTNRGIDMEVLRRAGLGQALA